VVLLTLAVQLSHLFFQPRTSDDAYRYIWDGRVLLAGVDPYRFAPLDSALAGLRYPLLFPEGELPLISRPGVPTIYPPIAQLWLALVAFFTPRAAGTLRLQIAAAGAVVLTTWLLARFLGNRQGGSCSTEPARRSRLGSLCSSTSDGGAKAATNAGNYTPAGTAPRSSGVGRAQQARLE